jgi:hypothetical protein
VVMLRHANTEELECWRCMNFLRTFLAFLEMATYLLI